MIMKKVVSIIFICFLSILFSILWSNLDRLKFKKIPGGEILRIIKKGQIVELFQSEGKWVFVNDISVNKKVGSLIDLLKILEF